MYSLNPWFPSILSSFPTVAHPHPQALLNLICAGLGRDSFPVRSPNSDPMGWGKDPIGLVIKVSKLAVVPATRNPSTARGVGEGEAEVGGWRKERQLGSYSETRSQKRKEGGGEDTPGMQGKLCGSEIIEDSSQTLPWWNPQADLGTRPRQSQRRK